MSRGFSLIETVLVISLFSIVLLISAPILFTNLGGEKAATLAQNINSALKEAQNKAMSSEALGQASPTEFGVHFTSSNYTIFQGSSYNSSDPNNFVNQIDNGTSLTTNLPCISSPTNCNNLVFSKLVGEVVSFDQTKNTLCAKDNAGNGVLLTINSAGVVNVQKTSC
ncbi:MAG TPA: type II secretion system protein [Candidatus Saccharimonadales bacterium]|nr:type II secretion system protein [Candidatus Saccharimonadales bacterium]